MQRSLALLILLHFTPATAHAGKYIHLVLPGDSLSKIAKRYHTTPDRIRALNGLKSDNLRDGQKLKVQSSAPATTRIRARHIIHKGDTLASVAKRHKMTVALVKRLNPKLGSKLRPGQVVWVIKEEPPDGSGGGSVGKLYALEAGEGFKVVDPRHAYGTMLTVTRVAEVLSEHGIHNPEKPLILIGDISKKGGGFLAPHHSHRRGRDVDIRYPLKHASKEYEPATPATLDLKRTWSLIQAFIKTGDVLYVFMNYKLQRLLYEYAQEQGVSEERLRELFQYPRNKHAQCGIIRHEPGHRTHFHLRFKADSDEGPTS